MLLRLTYLAVTNAFAVLRLLPMSDRDKDAEILVLRHQLAVLQRQLGLNRARFAPEDRVLLAALLKPLPRDSAPAEYVVLAGQQHGRPCAEAVDAASNLVLCSWRRLGHDGRLCCCV